MGQQFTVVIDSGGMARTHGRIFSAKGSNDTVQWLLPGGGSRKIRFQTESPFTDGLREFVVSTPPGPPKKFHPAKFPGPGAAAEHFKYDILAMDDSLMDDPVIILED